MLELIANKLNQCVDQEAVFFFFPLLYLIKWSTCRWTAVSLLVLGNQFSFIESKLYQQTSNWLLKAFQCVGLQNASSCLSTLCTCQQRGSDAEFSCFFSPHSLCKAMCSPVIKCNQDQNEPNRYEEQRDFNKSWTRHCSREGEE